VAVVAHRGKKLGNGLDELLRLLTGPDVEDLFWYEVPKSRLAPKQVRRALKKKPDVLVVWGGDGMMQRCADALVGHDVPVAVIPAGTANLLARNLGIPIDLPAAVRIALDGARRRLDLGRLGGEHFAVMAGLGFDAEMIDGADGPVKRRLGRLAYLWSGARSVGTEPAHVKIKLDGAPWFAGDATCVLVANVAKVFGDIEVFSDATPDDGYLDVGVTTARTPLEWAGALSSIGVGTQERSPYLRLARAKRISVRLRTPLRYELDGGSRGKVTRAKFRVVPAAVTVCVPRPDEVERA